MAFAVAPAHAFYRVSPRNSCCTQWFPKAPQVTACYNSILATDLSPLLPPPKQQEGGAVSMHDLPNETLTMLLGSLCARDLAAAQCVCASWRALGSNPALWEAACRKRSALPDPCQLYT